MQRAETEKNFAWSLQPMQRNWRRLIEKTVRRHTGHSFAMVSPLLSLSRYGDGQRHGALAEAVGIEAPSLVRLVTEAESLGLVTRRDLESDGRVKTIHLTPAGRKLAAEVEVILTKLRADVLEGIPDELLMRGAEVHAAMLAGVARVDAAENA